MARLAVMIGVYLGSAALGLLAAAVAVDGFRVRVFGFVTTVVIYAIVQGLVTPWLSRVAAERARYLVGLTGLGATVIALVIASWFGRALWISGLSAWAWGALVVWIVSSIAAIALPRLLVALGVEAARDPQEE
ncbi:phage holin family protein [Aeromicrobium sp. YIM 150415]|uniref:phage holin family protein n=1 Tax=Aeromicrobium sp. YIM 150415 TaxID=2803912 RepID=UPI001962D904|nr:phage holin family protein [Aeromicrobium sp. YIM 150415]MBM9461885.1 phage holin family protein [Aeromicrobium sp. YIM 150415]